MDPQSTEIADPSNAGQLEAWDGKEGAFWAAQARRFDETLARPHALLLEAAAIQPVDHVLDIGCGTGQTTRDVGRTAVRGSALGIDLSSQMIALARKTAAAEGLGNVEFQHADAQIHHFQAEAYDAVISRFGSMFFGDPVAAFANLRSALRPNGRLTLLTWQALADNEWLWDFREAMAMGRTFPLPPPGAPGAFALSDPERVTAILRDAGFSKISFQGHHEPVTFGSNEEDAYDFVSGFIGWMREGLDEEGQEAANTALRATIARHTRNDVVTYQSATWLIQARRP